MCGIHFKNIYLGVANFFAKVITVKIFFILMRPLPEKRKLKGGFYNNHIVNFTPISLHLNEQFS